MEVVLQVLLGVAPALVRELADLGAHPDSHTEQEVRLTLPRDRASLALLGRLRTAVAASLVVTSPDPRPLGLLATPVLRDFAAALEAIAWQRPRVRFHGLRLEAAGSDSPQLRRVAAELADLAGVEIDDGDGDLVVRVRRAPGPGWEALVRTTARPLATRPWRTERYPGALNATIAAAVVAELGVDPGDVVADLMCGSGTLLLERMARGPARRLIAVDVAPHALAVLQVHQRAARVRGRVDAVLADVAQVARADGVLADAAGTATVVMSNPPWGELLGEHGDNERLYRELLDAVDRIGATRVRAGILTHDIRRFERLLEHDPRWRVLARPQFFAKGHQPRLFVLERAETTG